MTSRIAHNTEYRRDRKRRGYQQFNRWVPARDKPAADLYLRELARAYEHEQLNLEAKNACK